MVVSDSLAKPSLTSYSTCVSLSNRHTSGSPDLPMKVPVGAGGLILSSLIVTFPIFF